MSINHFFNKIKSKLGIDNTTILYFLIIIGVGIASFGLGQLSVSISSNNNETSNIIKENQNTNSLNNSSSEIKIIDTNKNIISTETIGEKMYVASKNGKLYYPVNCSGANRIKEENKVWFATTTDAEKSGFAYASSCK